MKKLLAMKSETDDELWVGKQQASSICRLTPECETYQVLGRPAGLSSSTLESGPGSATGRAWKNVTGTEWHWIEGEVDRGD